VRSEYQEKLDAITAEALAPLSQMPRYRLGVHASKPSSVSYLAHVFLHGGWLHLLVNGILLLILGSYVERVWGHALFGVLAVATALAAATAFRIENPELDASLIGTSGVIAGLIAACALRAAARWTDASYGPVLIGGIAWLALAPQFGWDGSIVPGPAAGDDAAALASSALWAVTGGFGCGLVISALIVFGKLEAIFSNAEPEPARKPSVDPDLAAALEARADGRSDEAFALISELLQREPDHRAALLAMWEVALDLGRTAEASQAMFRVVRDEVRRNIPSAVDHWIDLTRHGLDAGAEPALLIHVALMLCEAERRAEALSALERALEISAETGSPEIAARVARASKTLDRGFTEAAAWHALGSVELAFKDRQNLEALLAELHREPPEAPPAYAPPVSYEPPAEERATSVTAGSAERSEYSRDRSPAGEADAPTGAPTFTRAEPIAVDAVHHENEGRSAAESDAPARPVPIDLEIMSRELRVVRAQPMDLVEDGIVIEIEGGSKRVIGFDRVDAVSVVAVDGLGPKFVIVIDLVLNWMSEAPEPLKVIRLRGDRFDPRPFSPGRESPLDAMRDFTKTLLERCQALALPDKRSVRGEPFASFPDLASYHRTVLSVEDEAPESDASA